MKQQVAVEIPVFSGRYGKGEPIKSFMLICPRANPVSAVATDQKQAVLQTEKMECALSGLPADR